MPRIKCLGCGKDISIDELSLPYKGEIVCSSCNEKMIVDMDIVEGTEVHRIYPSLEELRSIWKKLNPIERRSLQESSYAFGSKAYTASELMSLRSLEGLLRRIYGKEETLGSLIKRMEKDTSLSDLEGIFSYFKTVRNRIAHPEKLSSKLDAESTFSMTKRLILEIMEKK